MVRAIWCGPSAGALQQGAARPDQTHGGESHGSGRACALDARWDATSKSRNAWAAGIKGRARRLITPMVRVTSGSTSRTLASVAPWPRRIAKRGTAPTPTPASIRLSNAGTWRASHVQRGGYATVESAWSISMRFPVPGGSVTHSCCANSAHLTRGLGGPGGAGRGGGRKCHALMLRKLGALDAALARQRMAWQAGEDKGLLHQPLELQVGLLRSPVTDTEVCLRAHHGQQDLSGRFVDEAHPDAWKFAMKSLDRSGQQVGHGRRHAGHSDLPAQSV